MQKHRRFGALSSSQDPDKLAAWVTGVLISFSSIIAIVLTHILPSPVIAEQVVNYAGPIGAGIGSIWFLFGLLRKGVAAIAEKKVV